MQTINNTGQLIKDLITKALDLARKSSDGDGDVAVILLTVLFSLNSGNKKQFANFCRNWREKNEFCSDKTLSLYQTEKLRLTEQL